jgi:hypothetical protein
VRQIESLFNQFQAGQITLRAFAEQFHGQASALENLRYSQIKEAQTVGFRLRMAAEQMEGNPALQLDLAPLRAWLVEWLAAVPRDGTVSEPAEEKP